MHERDRQTDGQTDRARNGNIDINWLNRFQRCRLTTMIIKYALKRPNLAYTVCNYARSSYNCWNGLLIPDLDHALHSDRAWLSGVCRLPVLTTAVASKTCILHATCM